MAKKQSVVELTVRGTEESVKKLIRLEEATRKLRKTTKETRDEIEKYKEGGKSTDKLEKKLQKLLVANHKLKKGMKDTRREVNESNRAWDAAKFPDDSIIGMERAYSKLRKTIRGLSKDQRESTFGKSIIKESRKIKDAIRSESEAFGDTYHSVGNYQSAIENALRGQGSFSGNMKSLAVNTAKIAGPMFLAVKGVQLLGEGIKSAIDITLNYEQANADLAAVMGITIGETERLQVQSKDLGSTTAFTATQVSGMQLEMAKLGFTMDEIMAAGGGIVNFAVATGVDIPRAAALGGAALRAFNLDASEMDRVVSVMGVATTKSALDFAKLETAMSTVAPVANAFGFSIEDATALMGNLADAGFEASKIGTATRNILLNLADANGKLAKKLGGSVSSFDELIDGLKKLDEEGVSLNETLKLTDKRSVAAFTKFIKTADGAKELRDGLIDVNDELTQMAETKLDTVKGKVTLLSSAWEGLVLSTNKGSGALSNFVKGTITSLTESLGVLTAMNDGVISFKEAMASIYSGGLNRIGQISTTELIKQRRELQKEIENDRGADGLYLPKKSSKSVPFISNKEKKDIEALEKERQKVIAKAKEDAAKDAVKKTKSIAKKGVVGSIDYLQKQVSDLRKELELEVKSDSGIKKTLEQITGYESKLKAAKENITKIKRELEGKGGKVREASAIGTKDLVSGTIITPTEADPNKVVGKAKQSYDEFFNYQEAKEKQRHKERLDREKELQKARELAYQAMETVADGILQIQSNRIENERDKELTAAEEVYNTKIKNAHGNAAIEESAKKELEKKKEEIEKKAAKKRKRIAYSEAVIQGALAIIKASPNFLLMAAAALTTAVNLAVISNTKFAKGVFTGKAAPGTKTDSTGRKPTATYTVHELEYIADHKTTERYNDLFEAMETKSDSAIQDAMYNELIRSDYKDIAKMPAIFPQIHYKESYKNTNKGVESKLSDLQKEFRSMKTGLREEMIKGVIIGMDRGARMIERKNIS